MTTDPKPKITSAVTPFNFKNNEVRTLTDEKGDPWFLAVDVCNALSLSNSRKAVSALDDDEKFDVTISYTEKKSIGSTQKYNIVNEFGLYNLIFNSRKPEAKAFKRWVTHEVLPQIRKSGTYSMQFNHPSTQALSSDDTPTGFNKGIDYQDGRSPVTVAIQIANTEVIRLELKVDSQETFTPRIISEPVQEIKKEKFQGKLLLPTNIGSRLNISPFLVNTLLTEAGYQEKSNRYGVYAPTEKANNYIISKPQAIGQQPVKGKSQRKFWWTEDTVSLVSKLRTESNNKPSTKPAKLAKVKKNKKDKWGENEKPFLL
jgi:prophage antirepressor-like protein